MKHSELARNNCSLSRTLAIIGERWTLLILRQFFLGLRRFDDLQATLGIARNILADRLKTLTEAGIVERRRLKDTGGHATEYRLTQKGRDLYPAIACLLEWGDTYMMEPTGPSVERIHKQCGHSTHPKLTCEHCGEAFTAHDVELAPGPSAHLGSPWDEARDRLDRR